jgi:hypothetical protein
MTTKAAIFDEGVEHKLPWREPKQRPVRGRNGRAGGFAAGGFPVMRRTEHPSTHLLEVGERQDAQRGLGLFAACGLNLHFNNAGDPVQDVLHRIDVLDAVVGHVPLIPEDHAGTDHEFARVVAVAE